MALSDLTNIPAKRKANEAECKTIIHDFKRYKQAEVAADPKYVEDCIRQICGFDPKGFQVEGSCTVLGRKNLVLQAPTGAGKTMLFGAPHLALSGRVSLVITPLILLQDDHVCIMNQILYTSTSHLAYS